MLYASATVSTILSEFKAKEKDEFYIIRIRPQKGKILTGFVIGDLNYYRISGRSYYGTEKEHEIREKIINQNCNEDLARIYLVDAFLAEMFMHPTKDSYKITASITDLFLGNNNRIHTLVYPSVRFSGKANFVMSPAHYEEIMECYECFHIRINKSLEYGIYSPETLHYAKAIYENGDIEWEHYKHGPQGYIF